MLTNSAVSVLMRGAPAATKYGSEIKLLNFAVPAMLFQVGRVKKGVESSLGSEEDERKIVEHWVDLPLQGAQSPRSGYLYYCVLLY